MPAQRAANPMYIPAGNALPLTLFNYECKIAQVEMQGYTAATDTATFTDVDGNIVAQIHAKADFSTERTGKVGWTKGLICTALPTTGEVIVYFE